MMRTVLLFIWLLLIFNPLTSISQQPMPKAKGEAGLVGVWQIGSAEVNNGLNANWRFFADGKFRYSVRGSGTNPLTNIYGTYYVDEKELHSKIERYEILRGFRIEVTDPGAEFGHFKLEGGKKVFVEQKDSTYSPHDFKMVTPKVYIVIDGDNYYRVSGDPKKEF